MVKVLRVSEKATSPIFLLKSKKLINDSEREIPKKRLTVQVDEDWLYQTDGWGGYQEPKGVWRCHRCVGCGSWMFLALVRKKTTMEKQKVESVVETIKHVFAW